MLFGKQQAYCCSPQIVFQEGASHKPIPSDRRDKWPGICLNIWSFQMFSDGVCRVAPLPFTSCGIQIR